MPLHLRMIVMQGTTICQYSYIQLTSNILLLIRGVEITGFPALNLHELEEGLVTQAHLEESDSEDDV